jgi:hypothetical protein
MKSVLGSQRLSGEAHERAGALAERNCGALGIGSCRREILDHIIAVSERHLRRLIRDYVAYHHDDRIHDSFK